MLLESDEIEHSIETYLKKNTGSKYLPTANNDIEKLMHKLKKSRIESIAVEFLNCANPDKWDKTGTVPANLDLSIYEFALTNDTNLEITICCENSTYRIACDLVHTQDNSSFKTITCNTINSAADLTNAIMSLCAEYN